MNPSLDFEAIVRGANEVAERVAKLLRGVKDPGRPAIGEWNIAELACHVAFVGEGDTSVAKGLAPPPEDWGDTATNLGPDAVTAFNDNVLAADGERDLSVLADRIAAGTAAFREAVAGANGDDLVYWLGGVKMPLWTIASHLLSELELHGFDIARADGVKWSIDPAHAAVAFEFFAHFLSAEPRTAAGFINQPQAAGLNARIEVRLRGFSRAVFAIDDGVLTIEEPGERADCVVSADPVDLLLVSYNRKGMWGPILRGQLTAWGRRPWLAPRLTRLLRTP
jgi:uncharacterized protein (TIGR03083 family)